ncbi:hypothetical protein Aazo_5341 (plasmid) ['Nostoc azollae' 0708]|jgi:hypothetical protein|uniref:Uncharacterized protein n=2 Tax=Trichormus azollae TaxID=1164 RepID=D7E5P8_NOSA0|nr:hypothetical protein Aazo_5341 ['Nostoc azollae' 0708]
MKFHQNKSTSLTIADAKKEAKRISEYFKTPSKSQERWQGVKKWILVSNIAFASNDDKLKWNKDIKTLFTKLALEIS